MSSRVSQTPAIAERGLLARLRGDVRGNTLAIMAASLVPLTAIAGSAVDMSRMYVVKVRLQQACDAGALAGRKFMTGTTYTPAANTQAETFFGNNFKTGIFGSGAVTKSFSETPDNQVAGTASAVVPMTLMKTFGMADQTITVTCEAKLEIPNLDVMFVLDTTGSMGDTNPGDTSSKIVTLRSAVSSFYDTLEAAKTGSSQVRYGFVPYSSTVNVGQLLKREWMVDSWTYQSREPAQMTTSTSTGTQGPWNPATNGPVTTTGTRTTTYAAGSPESCYAPANTLTTSSAGTTNWANNGDGSQSRTVVSTQNGSTYTATLGAGTCTITQVYYNNYRTSYVQTQTPNPNAGQPTSSTTYTYYWNYKPVPYNVAGLKGNLANGLMAGGNVLTMTNTTPLLNNGGGSAWAPQTVSWPGTVGACIEERDTVHTTNYSPIPSAAYDMDVDMIPTSTDPTTQWRPFIPRLVYARKYGSYSADPTVVTSSWPDPNTAVHTVVNTSGNYVNLSSYPNDYAACPTAAKKLATITKPNLTAYLNSLKVAGRTYHDVGFVWGLRLLSPTGLFASENATAPNGSPIARNIIFMTDGQTETNYGDYDAYGLAGLDRRRTDPTRLPLGNGETDSIVESRLTALCRVAQQKNITVWVIAFGTTLTPLLSGCATPGAHAFQANNATELNNAFASIASSIAKLRISK